MDENKIFQKMLTASFKFHCNPFSSFGE